MRRITPMPPLPPEIKEAVDRRNLAVLVGAGVSRVIGCVGWSELARDLANLCYQKQYVSYRECEGLLDYSRSGDHRKTISICRRILESKSDGEAFYEKLEGSLAPDPGRLAQYPVYDELYRFRALFVTTNIDKHFDRLFTDRSVAYHSADFVFVPEAGIDHSRLYHLHGVVDDRESLVLTLADYLRRYRDVSVRDFLTHLFDHYRVLFVGYGLREFELLEYVISRHSSDDAGELRHFYLKPFFSEQESILDFERSYFEDLGIEVLPYSKDLRGYDQLYEVISEWQAEINMLSSYMYDAVARVEGLAAFHDRDREEELFQLIRNDPALVDHFFKVVTSPEWLPPLVERGYLSASGNPGPVESEDSPGYYRIPYWNVLDYLERVAEQVSTSPDSDIATTLMQIVRSVSNYRDDEGQRIDNYHTDQSFVKVMARVPVEALRVEDMERVRAYLVETRWRASDLIGAEIGKSLLPRLLEGVPPTWRSNCLRSSLATRRRRKSAKTSRFP